MENTQPCGAGVAWHAARDAEAMALFAEEILREEAWWIAVRAGQYAHPATVWADGPGPLHGCLRRSGAHSAHSPRSAGRPR